MTRRSIGPLRCARLSVIVAACATGAFDAQAQTSARADSLFAAGMRFYWANEIAKAFPLLDSAVRADTSNIDRVLWFAETARRMDQFDIADAAARFALRHRPCSSFGQLVLASLYDPQFSVWPRTNFDTTWVHVNAAIQCDPADGNAWMLYYLEASRREHDRDARHALHQLIASGQLAPPYVAFARWLLTTAPRDAILLTAGDLDFFPALALQEEEGLRPDVTVVNIGLLDMDWYALLLYRTAALPFPMLPHEITAYVPGNDGNPPPLSVLAPHYWRRLAAHGTLPRPLLYAFTSGWQASSESLGTATVMGPYFLVQDSARSALVNREAIGNALDQLHMIDLRGDFLSPADRSPVRKAKSVSPAIYVYELAVIASAYARKEDDRAGAVRWQGWADSLAAASGLSKHDTAPIKAWANQLAADTARASHH